MFFQRILEQDPFTQLILFMMGLAILFWVLVVSLDKSNNFALKRDWRDK
tara:strand:+ start:306 stop:452 length:147 start_codon:yes stop_codon:yes gene_type:complete